MFFNSFAFAIFAPIFFILYFSTRGSARLWLILGSSYFFYAWWDWRFVSLLLISTAVDYFIGLRLTSEESHRKRKLLLITSLCSNLGILFTFKYFDFFSESFQALFNEFGWSVSPPLIDVILPVGISFYTFQTLSYTIDIYRRRLEAETSLLRFASYVALFPQLVAGPIVRAASLLPQLRKDHNIDYARIGRGLEMVAWGFFLKLCLADTAATVADPRFDNPELPGTLSHIIGVVSFSFQIYGDFAGYSLIAIGLGRIMGFDFGINFNRPYFSASFSEFWGRWHISLSTWLRDYLYIPLGGNRGGTYKTLRNLLVTMLLGGLWHGASMNFVVWGFLHGAYLVLQRMLGPAYSKVTNLLRIPNFLTKAFLILLVFSLTNLAWIFFRAADLDQALIILDTILEWDDFNAGALRTKVAILKTGLIIAIVLLVDLVSLNEKVRSFYMRNTTIRFLSLLSIIWMIVLFGTFDGASFIYFQF